MLTFCTLFNTNYLDKGLVLYDSLRQHSSKFSLYVLAMDDTCYKILTDLNYPDLIPIKLSDFEDKELLQAKSNRTSGEYCWTCTPSLILYVLKKYQTSHCAYIDADLYFYSDPIVILKEMINRKASVQITGHRFYDDEAEQRSRFVGKYCVEFNTFMNDPDSLGLLETWRNQCLDDCSADGDGIHFGDQKYMDNWIDNYSFAIETENLGAGVAPWNIAKYQLVDASKDLVSCENKEYELLFYHFQNIRYYTQNCVDISCYGRKGISEELVNHLYIPYLKRLDEKKNLIHKKYGINILITRHPGFKKKNIMRRILSRMKYEAHWFIFRNKHKNEIHPRLSAKLNRITF